jgi:hypothetical protein
MSLKLATATFLTLLLALPAAAASPRRAPAPPAAPPAALPDPDRLIETRAPAPDPRRWSLADLDHGTVGIGLFSVGGHFARDRERQGREPLSGTGGRENQVAAVGLSLRF